ncbi:lipoprotein [uncultured Deefgea sp.]|uniref:LPS translocon maturation chaperone LptM n=1 Tax=uncultured Deefgea sp. TaxID=1304914 RepID=UPI0035B65653
MRVLIAFLLTAFFLTACGFKGPLYLPKTSNATTSSNNILIASSAASSASAVNPQQ